MTEMFPTCVHGRDVAACPFCHARRTDPPTSHAAARRLPKGHKGAVLAALRDGGPATQSELAARTGLLPHQVNKRLADLKREHLAAPTGRTRTGITGRDEREWEPT